MTWNFRIIEHDGAKQAYIAVHEVYYSDEGSVTAWTSAPINLTAQSKKDITEMLQHITIDITLPVLKESQLMKSLSQGKSAASNSLTVKHTRT